MNMKTPETQSWTMTITQWNKNQEDGPSWTRPIPERAEDFIGAPKRFEKMTPEDRAKSFVDHLNYMAEGSPFTFRLSNICPF